MEPLNNSAYTFPRWHIILGIFLLSAGLLFGLTGALQYLIPGFLKGSLSFEKIRPLHVSSMVFWIIMGAVGSALCYLQESTGRSLYSSRLVKVQFYIFLGSILAILISYFKGVFGGREYWEFSPIFAIPLIAGWILFIINFFKSVGSFKNRPVYIWMWSTGVIFFLFTFLESYLWVFPYFREHIVNDMTIQWKSYGSMVGSWNMLIYGCGIFLMEKISGNKKYGTSGIAFLLYFTGLFNLMFNWGHHIYTLPTHSYVKHISYLVSMTELFIFGKIIFEWRSSLSTAQKHYHHHAYRFIVASDVWIFLTLILALVMSIPAFNVFTHGTHITVAHTMGATIGINTFLLLAFGFDILKNTCNRIEPYLKMINRGFLLTNLSLFVFWISLIAAGVVKAQWQMEHDQAPFSSMMHELKPYFIVFFISGLTLATGILMIVYPLLRNYLHCAIKGTKSEPLEVNTIDG